MWNVRTNRVEFGGLGLILNFFSNKKEDEVNIENIVMQFEAKRVNGSQVICAVMAEIVDFRTDFAEKDSESKKVIDSLEQISPDQYVRKLSSSNRRIKISV